MGNGVIRIPEAVTRAALASTAKQVTLWNRDASHGIQCAVNELNRAVGCAAFAYTFDAGPNPFLISSCKHMPLMLHLLAKLGKSVRSAPTAKPSFEPDEQQLKLAAQLETEGLLAAFEPVCEAILSRTLSK